MYKFEIEYAVTGSMGDTRRGVVFAEDMDAAVLKIATVDNEYSHTIDARFKEYPNWGKGGER